MLPFLSGLLLGLVSLLQSLLLNSCPQAIRDFWLLSSTYSTVSCSSSCFTLSIPLQTERDYNIEMSVSFHPSNSHELQLPLALSHLFWSHNKHCHHYCIKVQYSISIKKCFADFLTEYLFRLFSFNICRSIFIPKI